MEALELKRRYESLSDDEIMRVCADKGGLTEIAASVLAEEMARRKLNDTQSQARVRELGQDLAENRARYERGQRRIARRAGVCAFVLVGGAVAILAVWILSKLR